MIVYNTTFHIAPDIYPSCIDFLKKVYIPRAASGGFLMNPSLRRVLQENTEEGESIAIQFHVKNRDTLYFWLEKEGQQLHKELTNRFGSKIAGFSTLLEEIDWEKE